MKANAPAGTVECPECLISGTANPDNKKGSMDSHMRRYHAAAYIRYYGVPCPARTPCTQTGCPQTFSTGAELGDHLLKGHNIEQAHHLQHVPALRRMRLVNLNDKFRTEAIVQNALKQRIVQAEAQLAAGGDYHSAHGLCLALWSESGHIDQDASAQAGVALVRANPPPASFTVEVQYVSEQLRDLRVEAELRGLLLDGTQGTYALVAQELEGTLLSLDGGAAQQNDGGDGQDDDGGEEDA